MQLADEIPEFVKVLKSFVKHEWKSFDNILESRSSYLSASSLYAKANVDNQIAKALKSVFAMSEACPEISSNENFLKLHHSISDLENEIPDRKKLYNESINNYNIRIQSISDTFVVKTLGLAA
jgi:LemA protein